MHTYDEHYARDICNQSHELIADCFLSIYQILLGLNVCAISSKAQRECSSHLQDAYKLETKRRWNAGPTLVINCRDEALHHQHHPATTSGYCPLRPCYQYNAYKTN